MMPGRDGFSIVRHLRRGNITTPVLFLSARSEVADRIKGLDAGGDDYLVKPFSISELLARIRALLRRRRPDATTSLRIADLELDFISHQPRRGNLDIAPSNREFALLEFLMISSPRPVSRTAIIEHVWDQNFDSQTNVVNEVLQDELKRLSDYVDRMLLIARAEQGRIPISPEPFAIDSIVDDLIDTYRILAQTEHRSIRLRYRKDCIVQFDKQYVRQILHNLLANAIRHDAGPILLSVHRASSYTVLSCINAVNPAAKSSTLGVGLGLRLIQALAASVPGASFHTTKRCNHFVARLRFLPAPSVPVR
jgi:signal transduction histidine kinase